MLTMLSHLAGSVLTNSVSSMLSPELATHHESSHVRMTGSPSLHAESSLTADTAPGAAAEQSDEMEDVQSHISSPERVDDPESPETSDDDAEGEPDEDFDATMQTQIDEEESDDEADMSSPRPGKRKKRVDDEDYMMKNPELYGLRRSVRLISSSFLFHFANLIPSGTCSSVPPSCKSLASS